MKRGIMKRAGSFAVALAISVGVFAGLPGLKAQAATQYTDTAKHWAESYIQKWTDYGLLVGRGDGTFDPNGQMTVGEFATVLSGLMGYKDKAKNQYTDLPKGSAYEGAILQLAQAGLLPLAGTVQPNRPITRGDVFVYFAKAFEVRPVAGATKFLDDASIPVSQKGYINALQKDGALSGKPSGKGFVADAAGTLTRAELMTLFDTIAGDLCNKPGTVTKNSAKNLVINVSGVQLNGSTIGRNLFIAEGVGEGDARLNKVDVKGTVYVKGGGVNSVYFTDTKAGGVSVSREGVSLKLTNSAVNRIAANSSFSITNTITDKSIKAPDIVVSGSGVTLDLHGNIGNVTFDAGVKDVKIDGDAEIEKITAAKGVVEVSEELTVDATVVETPAPAASATAVIPSTGGGNGGGSGGGGSGGGGSTTPTASWVPLTKVDKTVALTADNYHASVDTLAGITFIVVQLNTPATNANVSYVRFVIGNEVLKPYADSRGQYRLAVKGTNTNVAVQIYR